MFTFEKSKNNRYKVTDKMQTVFLECDCQSFEHILIPFLRIPPPLRRGMNQVMI